jgi:hypothetical protein
MTDNTDRRTVIAPLTKEWFRCALHPRYAQDGTIFRTLTPPRHRDDIGPFARVAIVVGFIVVLFGAPLMFVIK